MSAALETRPALPDAKQPSRFRLQVFTDVARIAPFWDALAAAGGGTGYQRRAFLEPWIAHVTPALKIEPRLVAVSDRDGRPVVLLPLGLVRHRGMRALVYLGGRDANLRGPLIDPHADISDEDARALLHAAASAISPRPDLLMLTNQPIVWHEHRNPFALPGAFPSPSNAFGATIGADVEAFLVRQDSRDTRKKLRAKATKLAAFGPVVFARVPPAKVAETVDEFIAQKEGQLALRGIKAGLDTAHVRAFLTAMATASTSQTPLELFALQVGTTNAAIFGGFASGRHWHGMIISMSDDPALARCSPGELLLRHVLRDLGGRGFTSFDLGVGEARYKAALCDEEIALVDAIVPITRRSAVFAALETVRLAAKRRVKRSPWALKQARRAQALLPRRRPRP